MCGSGRPSCIKLLCICIPKLQDASQPLERTRLRLMLRLTPASGLFAHMGQSQCPSLYQCHPHSKGRHTCNQWHTRDEDTTTVHGICVEQHHINCPKANHTTIAVVHRRRRFRPRGARGHYSGARPCPWCSPRQRHVTISSPELEPAKSKTLRPASSNVVLGVLADLSPVSPRAPSVSPSASRAARPS